MLVADTDGIQTESATATGALFTGTGVGLGAGVGAGEPASWIVPTPEASAKVAPVGVESNRVKVLEACANELIWL